MKLSKNIPFFVLFLSLISAAGIAKAAISVGGTTTSYICEREESGAENCHCYDYFDCKDLKKSGKCDGDLKDGEGDSQACKWKSKKTSGNSHNFVKPTVRGNNAAVGPSSSKSGVTNKTPNSTTNDFDEADSLFGKRSD